MSLKRGNGVEVVATAPLNRLLGNVPTTLKIKHPTN